MNRQTLAQHADNLGILKGLVEALDRHNDIIKNHEEAQKLLALTDEQIKEINDLRELKEENKAASASLEKQRVTLENLKSQNAMDLEALEAQRKSLAESFEKLREEKIAVEQRALKNEEIRGQLEAERAVVAKLKADCEAKDAKLVEKEKALDLRAEKILLREKASEL